MLHKKSILEEGIALEVGEKLYDLSRHEELKDQNPQLVPRESLKGLSILRHTAAHVLAQAVKRLFPDVQVTIGPVIENVFYYNFLSPHCFQEADLKKIEEEMGKIADQNFPITREEWGKDEAIKHFLNINEPFKAEIMQDLPADEPLSVYQQGEFLDLCRGPHLPSTGALGKGFKLTKVSTSHWRGQAQGKPLQRIYGTAWCNEAGLATNLHQLEEAERRDHRKIGKHMGLFHFQEEAPGSVFWHPHGWTLYQELQHYIIEKLVGYQEVNTPQLVSHSLWQASGHWDVYRENMFSLTHNDHLYALKPMNCPCHVQIFKQGLKSYRDLPFRMSEFGSCMRNEPFGALSGLMRVRSFVQDDAYIFCAPEHIESETNAFCVLLKSIYKDLGFTDVLSQRHRGKRGCIEGGWGKEI